MEALPKDSPGLLVMIKSLFGEHYWHRNLNHFICYHLHNQSDEKFPYYPEITIKNNLGEPVTVILRNSLEPDPTLFPYDAKDRVYQIIKKYAKKKRFFQKSVLEAHPEYAAYAKEFIFQKKVLEDDLVIRVGEYFRNWQEYLAVTEKNAKAFYVANGWRQVPHDMTGYSIQGWGKIYLDFKTKVFRIKEDA